MTEPNWSHPAPAEAIAAIITSAEHASRGDQPGSITAIEAAVVDTRWTAIAACRILGSLMQGPERSERFTTLRTEILTLAADADAALIVLNSEVIDLAQAWCEADFEALDNITSKTQFLPSDLGKVGAQMIGQIICGMAGDDTSAVFDALRDQYRIENS